MRGEGHEGGRMWVIGVGLWGGRSGVPMYGEANRGVLSRI